MPNPNAKDNLEASFHPGTLLSTEVFGISSGGFGFRIVFQHRTENGQKRNLEFEVSFAQLLDMQEQMSKQAAEMLSERNQLRNAIRDLLQGSTQEQRDRFNSRFPDVVFRLTH